jgi:nicotinamide riboside transporter PnuC
MPDSTPVKPRGNTLLFLSLGLTLSIFFAFFAVTEHKPLLWLSATAALLILGRVQQARRYSRKEIETPNQ